MEAKKFMHSVIMPMFKDCHAPVTATVVQIGTGGSENIAEAICKEAEAIHAEMIIMTSRSRNVVTKFFLGSVTQNVASHSKVPLIIVH